MSVSLNVRLMCHRTDAPRSIGDRTYPATLGTVMDLPATSGEVQVLTANGWAKVAYVGTTAQRPTNLNIGDPYVDTTLGYVIYYSGTKGWREPISGTLV